MQEDNLNTEENILNFDINLQNVPNSIFDINLQNVPISSSHDVESQEKNLFNTFIIEKDKKSYKLTISKIDKDIIIKCRIEKPLKVFEKKFTKSDLEKLGKIFKGCDNIEEAYTYIINSLENKQYIFEETEKEIKIKNSKK